MPTIKELRADIAKMEKDTSLRQIALQSKINYITLRNIKFGKSKRVTDAVARRLLAFKAAFDPKAPKPAGKKRGRKPGKKAAPKAKTALKPKAPVKAKATRKAAKPVPAPLMKAAPAPKPVPVAKPTGKKRGRKPRAIAAPMSAAQSTSLLLGSNLAREISVTEARLRYLRQLQQVEAAYVSAVKTT